jgi:hypothetical protein
VAVFNPINGHRNGHIQIYNGNGWASDYQQYTTSGSQIRNDSGFFPSNTWLNADYNIYRHERLIDWEID